MSFRSLFQPAIPVGIGLLACTVFLGWFRWITFIFAGGTAVDYQAWASKYYFGGISRAYFAAADIIHSGKPWTLTSYPPGYPALIALCRFFGADDPQAFRLIQGGIDALGMVAAFVFARAMRCHWAVAIAAAAGYALLRDFAAASVLPLAEGLSPALMTASFAGMAFAARSARLRRWAAFAFIAGFAATCRSELVLFAGPIGVWWLVAHAKAVRWRTLATVIVAFAVPLVLASAYISWSSPNVRVLSKARWYALYAGLGQVPNDLGYFTSDERTINELLNPRGFGWHTDEAESLFRELYFEAWKDHPGFVASTITARVARIPFSRAAAFTGGRYLAPWSDLIVLNGLWITVAAALALLLLRRWRGALLLAVPVGYACCNLGWMYHEPRYTIYSHVGSVIAAAVLLALIGEACKNIAKRVLGPGEHRRLRRASDIGAALLLTAASIPLIGDLRSLHGEAISRIDLAAFDRALDGSDAEQRAGVMETTAPDLSTLRVNPPERLASRDDKVHRVTATPRAEYQAMLEVPVPQGARALRIDAEPASRTGPWTLGVLSGDQQRWISQQGLTDTDGGSQTLVLDRGQETVWLVYIGGGETGDEAPYRIDLATGSVVFTWGWLGSPPLDQPAPPAPSASAP